MPTLTRARPARETRPVGSDHWPPGGARTAEPVWAPRYELPWPDPVPEAHFRLAEVYERRTMLFPGWRELLVRRLRPQPGDTVLDVGCGPGSNFPALQAEVGPSGTIIGLDDSPELLAVAASRVTRRGWDNIELINAVPDNTRLSLMADAALFAAASAVLTSPMELANIIAHLRPGAALAAGGWQVPTSWFWPMRALVATVQSPYLGDVTGINPPWQLLTEHVTELHVSEIGFGTGYLVHATVTGRRGEEIPVASNEDRGPASAPTTQGQRFGGARPR